MSLNSIIGIYADAGVGCCCTIHLRRPLFVVFAMLQDAGLQVFSGSFESQEANNQLDFEPKKVRQLPH